MPSSDARLYLAKSDEFLAAAQRSLEEGMHVAATSLAVHAGINAADAICVALLAERSAGQEHEQARALLSRAGTEGAAAGRHLARLLPLKSRAEYEVDAVPKATARQAVGWAEKLVTLARGAVQRVGR
ncbi:MAG: DNA-binding protein [Acidimicrobiia bacterium]|nr:DNA-binding protein [Acidimicrobiia bacterium]